MALLGMKDVHLVYDGPMILHGISLQIEPGERVGLVGRNGTGKSSLLRVIEGRQLPDSGEVTRQQGLRVAGLAQEVPADLPGKVRESLDALAHQMGSVEEWEIEARIDRVIRDLKLEPDQEISNLSAGSKRRVLLAQALIQEPDLLVLDEPTNHLDIEVIQKLEESLQRFRGALVFVTHDRSFLRRLSTRILDLDRGDLRSYRCDYATYLARREVELEAESEERLQFDKKLAKEEAWIRRGVKARRARNQGRVRALHKLREERLARRERTGGMRAQLQESDRTGQLVLKADHVCKSYDSKVVIDDYNVIISRKDRIGIIGPNGCGKSTLLKLLLGELEPDSGTIKRGTKFEVAHFDQLHSTLDDSKTVEENVGQGSDKIEVGGGTRHIMGYLQDFLFTPEQIRGPIRKLSGGERNRLQLAKILAKPCNVLVMDEPTNDLDVETLELLEAMLAEFGGTLLLVSHDREFLNNVVTSTIAFDDDGVVREYDGGYDDWLRQRPVANKAGGKGRGAAKAGAASAPGKKPRRLNNKERAELENLPNKIVEFESEVAELNDRMAAPDFYKRKAKDITAARKRMASLEQKMEAALERWTELEAIAEAAKKK